MARIPYGDCTSAAVAAHFEPPRLVELTATVAAYNNDAQWQRFCAVAGLQDWVEHPDFATNTLRVAHHEQVVTLLKPVMKSKTVAQWLGEHTRKSCASSATTRSRSPAWSSMAWFWRRTRSEVIRCTPMV